MIWSTSKRFSLLLTLLLLFWLSCFVLECKERSHNNITVLLSFKCTLITRVLQLPYCQNLFPCFYFSTRNLFKLMSTIGPFKYKILLKSFCTHYVYTLFFLLYDSTVFLRGGVERYQLWLLTPIWVCEIFRVFILT